MDITRRQFVRLCGGTAAVVLPFGLTRCAAPRPAHELIEDVEWKKGLADAALRVATSRGAAFADVRVVRNLIQTIAADDQAIKGVPGEWHYGSSPEHVLEKVDIGFNVRVLKNGAWGFAASPVLSEDEAAAVAGLACDLADRAATTIPEPIRLVPEPVHVDTWVTPHEEDPFTVPLDEKVAPPPPDQRGGAEEPPGPTGPSPGSTSGTRTSSTRTRRAPRSSSGWSARTGPSSPAPTWTG